MRGGVFCSLGVRGKESPSSAFGTFSPAAAGAKGLVGTLAGARKKRASSSRSFSAPQREKVPQADEGSRVLVAGVRGKESPSSAFGTFSPAAAGAKGLVGTLAGARKKRGVVGESRRCRRRMRGRVFCSPGVRGKESPSSAFGTFSPAG